MRSVLLSGIYSHIPVRNRISFIESFEAPKVLLKIDLDSHRAEPKLSGTINPSDAVDAVPSAYTSSTIVTASN